MLSLEMVKNVVVFLQGVQAVAALTNDFSESATYTALDAVNGLFLPLAICGLLRLFAAPWLTDDYTFTVNSHSSSQSNLQLSPSGPKPTDDRRESRLSIDSLIDHHIRNGTYLGHGVDDVPPVITSDPSAVQVWGSMIFRVIYITPFLCAFAVCFMYLTPFIPVGLAPKGEWTISSWLLSLFYTAIVVPSIAIYGYYFVHGEIHRTTIIPCISTMWYKAYTVFVMMFMGVLLTVSGIETRKTVCGAYTTLPIEYGDPCARGRVELYRLGLGTTGLAFGLAHSLTESGQFLVSGLDGYCLGVPGPWQQGALLNVTAKDFHV